MSCVHIDLVYLGIIISPPKFKRDINLMTPSGVITRFLLVHTQAGVAEPKYTLLVLKIRAFFFVTISYSKEILPGANKPIIFLLLDLQEVHEFFWDFSGPRIARVEGWALSIAPTCRRDLCFVFSFAFLQGCQKSTTNKKADHSRQEQTIRALLHSVHLAIPAAKIRTIRDERNGNLQGASPGGRMASLCT